MATKLKNMKLTSVDLVRAGANQEADICLFKSADAPEAPESPTEEEKNIFKRFIDWMRNNPTEEATEPHSPIEKTDEAPDLEYLYKSALAESLHSIMQDDTLTKSEKKDMAEDSILQYSEKIRELNGDEEEAMEEEVQEEKPDDNDRFDELEEIRVHKEEETGNPYHGKDGKFTSQDKAETVSRPVGRERETTGDRKQVYRRGEGLGTGPVGPGFRTGREDRKRPTSRKRRVTGEGKQVHRRGEGLGTGFVGDGID